LTRSRTAVGALAAAVETDKRPSVRGAAAVALGQIGDASAAGALAGALSRRLRRPGVLNRVLRRNADEDEFVRRSAAIALGQMGSREGVQALVDALSDPKAPDDVRRESARALGQIGDASAVPALRAALEESPAPVVAVSPLVGGAVLKGPTDAFMAWAGHPLTADGIVAHYAGLLDGIVADDRAASVPTLETDVAMPDAESRRRVAAEALGFARALADGR
jgi:hypothetical protein